MVNGETVGTNAYMAPEVASGKVYGVRCDIFSIGVVLFNMLTQRAPFDKTVDRKQKGIQFDPKYELFMENKPKFWSRVQTIEENNSALFKSKTARNLIEQMLENEPKYRVPIAQIKDHAWVKGATFKSNTGEIATYVQAVMQQKVSKKMAKQAKKTKKQQKHEASLLQTHVSSILENKDKLSKYGDKESIPYLADDMVENDFADIYTTVDWRVVYETITNYVKKKLKGGATYNKENKSLLCKMWKPSYIEFSVSIFKSNKFGGKKNNDNINDKSRYGNINNYNSSNGNEIVYILKMKRFQGPGIEYNNVKTTMVEHPVIARILTGIPASARLASTAMNSKGLKLNSKAGKTNSVVNKSNKSGLSGLSGISTSGWYVLYIYIRMR